MPYRLSNWIGLFELAGSFRTLYYKIIDGKLWLIYHNYFPGVETYITSISDGVKRSLPARRELVLV